MLTRNIAKSGEVLNWSGFSPFQLHLGLIVNSSQSASCHIATVMLQKIEHMKYIAIIIIIIFPIRVFSQLTFEHEIGDKLPDFGVSAIETKEKGFLILGESYSFTNGSQDIFIQKTDNKGLPIWSKNYGGMHNEYAGGVLRIKESGYIIVGTTENYGTSKTPNVYVLRINEDGDTLWTKSYGTDFGEYGYSITESDNKDFLITGMAFEFSTSKRHILLLKIDSNGNQKWIKNIKFSKSYVAEKIINTNDNNYLILAKVPEMAGLPNCTHIRLLKINNQGDTLWTKKIENKCYLQAEGTKLTSDNGFIISGTSIGENTDASLSTDICLIKVNGKGEIEWQKQYGGNDYDFGHDVIQTSDLEYLILGETYRNENSNNYKDLVLYKVNCEGEIIWSRIFNSKGRKIGNSLIETKDFGFLICGTQNNNDGLKEDEILFMKVDKEGKNEK